jgi:hypothetical protein
MKTIEAQLVLRAQDETAEGLSSVRRNLASVQSAVERFRAAAAKFSDTRSNFRAAQLAVTQAAMAMRSATAPTVELSRAYEQAQRAVKGASAAFEAQKVAVLSAKEQMESYGATLTDLAAGEDRLMRRVAATDAALRRRARFGAAAGEMASNILPFAGPAVLMGTKRAVMAGARYQNELAYAYPAAGIGGAETEWARKHAGSLASRYPIVSSGDILELYRETRSVISGEVPGGANLSPQQRLAIAARDTQRVFPSVVQADAALKASGAGDPGDLQRLVKGFEALGVTQDPVRTEKLLDAYVRATQVAGKTIPVDNVLHAIQQMMGTGGMLSDDFIKHTFVSLVQEGGSRVGAGLGSMDMTFLGKLGNQQAAEWEKLGGLSPNDLIRTKTGAVKGLKPGHNIHGYQLALKDPDRFIWSVLVPAMVRAGYTTKEQQIAEVQKLFGSARARRIAAALVQQQPTYEQAAAKFDSAQGLGAADNAGRSATAALGELTTAFTTLMAALTSPAMDRAAAMMDKTAHFMTEVADRYGQFAKNNPHASEVAADAGIGGALYLGGKMMLGMARRLFGAGVAEAPGAGPSMLGTIASFLGPAAFVAGAAPIMAMSPDSNSPNWWGSRGTPNAGVGPLPFIGSLAKDAYDYFHPQPAEVGGAVGVNVKVDVAPSPSFATEIASDVVNLLGWGHGTSGSTGVSMPEAVAGP